MSDELMVSSIIRTLCMHEIYDNYYCLEQHKLHTSGKKPAVQVPEFVTNMVNPELKVLCLTWVQQ